jgi:hypothetical protein
VGRADVGGGQDDIARGDRHTPRADAHAQATMRLPGGQGLRLSPMPSLHYRRRPGADAAGSPQVTRLGGFGRALQN